MIWQGGVDESYCIRNESVVRGIGEIDLAIHPPPDIVIEIERSRSSLNKLSLFAMIGVPEVWRYDGEEIWIGTLAANVYTECVQMSGFPVKLSARILQSIGTASETELIRRFVKEV